MSKLSGAFRIASSLDVAANTLTSGVFALALIAMSSSIDHEPLAGMLLDYSLATVAAWLFTLGAPTRFVSFSSKTSEGLARAVWQTLLTSCTLLAAAYLVSRWTPAVLWPAWLDRLRDVLVVAPAVLLGYIGRELANVAFGRRRTSLQCLAQTLAGLAVAGACWRFGGWSGVHATGLFLAIYYSNGAVQLMVFLLRERMTAGDVRLSFLLQSGRTNLALGFSTLLLGNFDKLALAGRSSLAAADTAYLIADRLAGAYGTVMTHYTQSRVQRAVSANSWTDVEPVKVVDAWFRRSLPSVILFTLVGGVTIGLGADLIGLQVRPWLAAVFVVLICATLHLKNSSGYAIRLLDILGLREKFNTIALILTLIACTAFSVLEGDRVEIIIGAKLALHMLMLLMLRNACHLRVPRS